MSYCPEPDSHVRDEVKVVLELSNYATKYKLEQSTGVGISYLAAKKYFIALKTEVNKLYINKLVNVPTSLNNSKTETHNLNFSKLKTVSVNLKKLNVAVDNEVI